MLSASASASPSVANQYGICVLSVYVASPRNSSESARTFIYKTLRARTTVTRSTRPRPQSALYFVRNKVVISLQPLSFLQFFLPSLNPVWPRTTNGEKLGELEVRGRSKDMRGEGLKGTETPSWLSLSVTAIFAVSQKNPNNNSRGLELYQILRIRNRCYFQEK